MTARDRGLFLGPVQLTVTVTVATAAAVSTAGFVVMVIDPLVKSGGTMEVVLMPGTLVNAALLMVSRTERLAVKARSFCRDSCDIDCTLINR